MLIMMLLWKWLQFNSSSGHESIFRTMNNYENSIHNSNTKSNSKFTFQLALPSLLLHVILCPWGSGSCSWSLHQRNCYSDIRMHNPIVSSSGHSHACKENMGAACRQGYNIPYSSVPGKCPWALKHNSWFSIAHMGAYIPGI